MNSRRCISTTPLKDYAECSRSAPCIAAKAGTLLSALGQERTSTVHLPMSAFPRKRTLARLCVRQGAMRHDVDQCRQTAAYAS
jgi:hypothetical protein